MLSLWPEVMPPVSSISARVQVPTRTRSRKGVQRVTKMVVNDVNSREAAELVGAMAHSLADEGQPFRMLFDYDEVMRLVAYRRAIQAGVFNEGSN